VEEYLQIASHFFVVALGQPVDNVPLPTAISNG